VRLHVANLPDTLLVWPVGLGSNQLGEYVHVAQNGMAAQRMASIGAIYGDRIAITQGGTAADTVIVGNLQKIAPVASVQSIGGHARRPTGLRLAPPQVEVLVGLRSKNVAARTAIPEVRPPAPRGQIGAHTSRDKDEGPVRAGIGMKRNERRSQTPPAPLRD